MAKAQGLVEVWEQEARAKKEAAERKKAKKNAKEEAPVAEDAPVFDDEAEDDAPAPVEQQTNDLFDDSDDSDDSDGEMFTGGELPKSFANDDNNDDYDAKAPAAPKPSQEDLFGADSDGESDEELQPAKKRSNEGDDKQVKKRMRVADDEDE